MSKKRLKRYGYIVVDSLLTSGILYLESRAGDISRKRGSLIFSSTCFSRIFVGDRSSSLGVD